MLYKVFLDTNIYDGVNYSFHNALFLTLRNKAASDELELHINSVVEDEVKAHISRDVKRAAKELSQAISNRSLAGFRKLPPHIIKCFLLKIQGFSTFHISVNKPQL